MRRCLLPLLLVMALSLSGLLVVGRTVAMRAPRGPALQPTTPRAVSTLSRSDVNGDCAIDLLDLALVSASYHAPYPFPHAQADINGDGAIDLLDLVLVAMNYGWRCPRSNILVAPSCSRFDPPRNDDPYLAEECVCLQNVDGPAADLSGWHVRDEQGNRYEFPPFGLPGGAYVRLHTGIGINTGTDLYWGRDSEVWDNSGDTVFVYDDEWQLVERYSYRSGYPPPVPTSTPAATPLPTRPQTPTPPMATPTPSAAPAHVVIRYVFYDGVVPRVESDEYAEIMNQGGGTVNLAGWRLNAGDPGQDFTFPSFGLLPGRSCRVYTNEVHPETGGFSFRSGHAIWNNDRDCGDLFDASGAPQSHYCY